jgi:hypothetical protein
MESHGKHEQILKLPIITKILSVGVRNPLNILPLFSNISDLQLVEVLKFCHGNNSWKFMHGTNPV